jgi:hypothetical protein
MRFKLTYAASLLAAGAAATAIVAAPIASAASTDQSCAGGGGGTVCQSPGNVRSTTPLVPLSSIPMGARPFCWATEAMAAIAVAFTAAALAAGPTADAVSV